jgi:hypothetical protein
MFTNIRIVLECHYIEPSCQLSSCSQLLHSGETLDICWPKVVDLPRISYRKDNLTIPKFMHATWAEGNNRLLSASKNTDLFNASKGTD